MSGLKPTQQDGVRQRLQAKARIQRALVGASISNPKAVSCLAANPEPTSRVWTKLDRWVWKDRILPEGQRPAKGIWAAGPTTAAHDESFCFDAARKDFIHMACAWLLPVDVIPYMLRSCTKLMGTPTEGVQVPMLQLLARRCFPHFGSHHWPAKGISAAKVAWMKGMGNLKKTGHACEMVMSPCLLTTWSPGALRANLRCDPLLSLQCSYVFLRE